MESPGPMEPVVRPETSPPGGARSRRFGTSAARAVLGSAIPNPTARTAAVNMDKDLTLISTSSQVQSSCADAPSASARPRIIPNHVPQLPGRADRADTQPCQLRPDD